MHRGVGRLWSEPASLPLAFPSTQKEGDKARGQLRHLSSRPRPWAPPRHPQTTASVLGSSCRPPNTLERGDPGRYCWAGAVAGLGAAAADSSSLCCGGRRPRLARWAPVRVSAGPPSLCGPREELQGSPGCAPASLVPTSGSHPSPPPPYSEPCDDIGASGEPAKVSPCLDHNIHCTGDEAPCRVGFQGFDPVTSVTLITHCLPLVFCV